MAVETRPAAMPLVAVTVTALLFPDVAKALERYLMARDIRDEHERVFVTQDGKPFTYCGLKQLVRRPASGSRERCDRVTTPASPLHTIVDLGRRTRSIE